MGLKYEGELGSRASLLSVLREGCGGNPCRWVRDLHRTMLEPVLRGTTIRLGQQQKGRYLDVEQEVKR